MPSGERNGRQPVLSGRGPGQAHYSTFRFVTGSINAEPFSDEDSDNFADDEADDPLLSLRRSAGSLPRYQDLEPSPPEYEHNRAGWFRRVLRMRTRGSEMSLQATDIGQGFEDEDEEIGTILCPACQVEIVPRNAGRCSLRRSRRAGSVRARSKGMGCAVTLALFLVVCLLLVVVYAWRDTDGHEKVG